jgi:antitoxin ParD1/3/4
VTTIGFRATESDRVLLRQLTREGESTSDVIRRALRRLDDDLWHARAQRDAERIDASGEDLNAEPEAW